MSLKGNGVDKNKSDDIFYYSAQWSVGLKLKKKLKGFEQ